MSIPFLISHPGRLYRFVLNKTFWPSLKKNKKHTSIDHCKNFSLNHNLFQKKWWGISGIYKLTFLPYRYFYYYGSSINLGQRFKYHFVNGSKQTGFLALFLKVLGWTHFSVTVVETCSPHKLIERENWYLKNYHPLLNMLTQNYTDPRTLFKSSPIKNLKISTTLKGRDRKVTDQTRAKMSASKTGSKNPHFGKSLSKHVLDAAAILSGTPIYVYDKKTFTLINGKPFRSIREVAKNLPISTVTVPKKLDTHKPFKGYYYFSKLQ